MSKGSASLRCPVTKATSLSLRNHPNNLYACRNLLSDDDDDDSISSNWTSEEESLLDGSAISSSTSMMNSSTMSLSSMMYSDNDDDTRSISGDVSVSSSVSSCSTIHYNPLTIHTGSFLDTLEVASPNDSMVSEESSLFHADHYFRAHQIASNKLEHPTSNSPDNYIFTDDDLSASSAEERNISMSLSEDTEDYRSDSKRGDSVVILGRTHHKHLAEADTPNQKEANPAKIWESYNQQRGRAIAHQLLSSYRGDSVGSTASLSEDECSTPNSPSLHAPCPLYPPTRTSFLKRVFRKRFVKSTSPLDIAPIAFAKDNKHRISDLAVRAVHDSSQVTKLSSAVLTRNTLVDFGAWEDVMRNNTLTTPSILNRDGCGCSVIEEEDGDESSTVADSGNPLSMSSESFMDEDDDRSILSIKVKAISLTVSDFIFGSGSSESSLTLRSKPVDRTTTLYDGLDGRCSSDNVADQLELNDEGHKLLAHIRGRAGIIDDLFDNGDMTEASGDAAIPWIHLFDTTWMPHYEEYVVRAVHSFSCRLLNRVPPTSVEM